ncbi:uncharacterized protein LOC117164160 [Bombus vancouverensis nearcticus]|uniref:uncharacterized protein LOC117164160 n=1 Tax=Bombus vancouverensis nearcticus TaxID=2705178 RepID=UPI00143AED2C|nr:putative uncharacterized protein DDB_G0286901 [Bombus vancouverensis nearcticus]XP_033202934.1 putative uncharacterized protein DDB_G0286901 [Bombus vancouverensis nearcticus]
MTTLKGIFPDSKSVKGKNFIHENVKNLRRIDHLHINKGTKDVQKSQISNRRKINNNNYSNNQNNNVLSKVNTNLRTKKDDNVNTSVNSKLDQHQELCKKISASTLDKDNIFMKKTIHSTSNNLLIKERKKENKGLHKCTQKLHENISSNPNFSYKSVGDTDNDIKVQIKVKNQGIQTLDTQEIDDLFSEGIVKYPSKKYLNRYESINKDNTNEEVNVSSRSITNSPLDQGDIRVVEKNTQAKNDTKSSKSVLSKEEVNFIKLNKEHTTVTNKIATQMNNNTSNNSNNNNLPTNYRMGVVPRYIKNRKEIQERVQRAKVEELDPNCPNGHVPLPDNERKETLQMLKKNYQDYVTELNMMPIKVDTLRAQRRKIEIEKQLNKLEEGIKVFSRPKVYVKMNA